jgi:hypothetical protein
MTIPAATIRRDPSPHTRPDLDQQLIEIRDLKEAEPRVLEVHDHVDRDRQDCRQAEYGARRSGMRLPRR